MTVEVVTEAQWEEKVLSQDHVIVDFWAEWCAYCKRLEPVYEKVSNEINDMTFVKVDSQSEMNLSQKYGVMGLPTIKFFCHGKEVSSVSGFRTEEQLKQDIARVQAEDESCAANTSDIKQ